MRPLPYKSLGGCPLSHGRGSEPIQSRGRKRVNLVIKRLAKKQLSQRFVARSRYIKIKIKGMISLRPPNFLRIAEDLLIVGYPNTLNHGDLVSLEETMGLGHSGAILQIAGRNAAVIAAFRNDSCRGCRGRTSKCVSAA